MITRDLRDDLTSALFHEAELLDDGKVKEWFEGLLTKEIDYRIPVRITRERLSGRGFSEHAWLMKENWHSLRQRVMRLDSEYAWAEDPASRIRHFVTNIRLEEGEGSDRVTVKSNVLLFWSRLDSTDFKLVSGERHDEWVREDDTWKLDARTVYLDHTTLVTPNLAIFI
ncbi:MAG: 3-phenylpropionate/cinnamic acid dioxygenase subunit beta [Actinobacteria bacterium]|nr:3-phenylpropionate/cinnamic acid dioxygenase subunit beta [Actinomycetota bacterium]